jgi:hypothetical protein
MKKLLFLLLFLPFLGNSQATFTAPVGYNTGAPTATPSGVGTRWRFDLLTGKKYTWLPGSLSWDEDARGIDQVAGCSAPLYTPGYNQSTFAINSCTVPELYQWTGAAWVRLNEPEVYTAGTGISITGTYPALTITNTGDLSATNELQDISLSGQTLSLTSDATPVTLPIINVVAGAGIGVSITSGAATVTNTGDTNASDDITTGTTLGGDLSGTLPNPTVAKIRGRTVSSTTPTSGQVLTYNTVTSEWEPTAPASGGHIIRDDGTDMTQRAALNFVSTSTVSAAGTDDAGNGETEVRLTVPTDGITATEIAADAVGASEIAADAVGSSEIAADAVGSSEIATDAVGATEIVADAVGTSELASTAVTPGSYTYMSGTVDADGRLTAASSGTAPVTGSGTTNYIPKWISSSSIGNSIIYNTGTSVGVNITSGTALFNLFPSGNMFQGGAYEIGHYSVNLAWSANNMYYNGSNWVYRNTGKGSTLWYNDGKLEYKTAPSASAGTTMGNPLTRFRVLENGDIERESANAVAEEHRLSFKSTYRVFSQFKSVSVDGADGYLDILTTLTPSAAGETGLITAMSIKRTGVQIPVGIYTENGTSDGTGTKIPGGVTAYNWSFIELPKMPSSGQGGAYIKFPYANAGANNSRNWIGIEYDGNFGQGLTWYVGRTGNVSVAENQALRGYYGFESTSGSGIPAHSFLGTIAINPANYAVAGTAQLSVRGSGTTSSTVGFSVTNSAAYPSLTILDDAKVGVGVSSPTQPLDVNGNARLRAALYDGTNSAGTSGNILSSTGSATQWKSSASVLAGSTYAPTGTADALGTTGDFSYDSNYIYVKTPAGWKRATLSTF